MVGMETGRRWGGGKGIECMSMWIHTVEFLFQYLYFFFFASEFIQI